MKISGQQTNWPGGCLPQQKSNTMNLNKTVLPQLNEMLVTRPNSEVFDLPEKVLQFGTGVLLRGLIDYFIDNANKQGVFNGRCVVVKTTGAAGTNEFEPQDNLYTHVLRGLKQGVPEEATRINAAISRVLHATHHWQQILACAEQPDLEIVVSNTTEVGIVLQPDEDIFAAPPVSFPGKLLALLYHRYKHFAGNPAKGWTIVPTELITDNGTQLKQIVYQLAEKHALEPAFMQWLQEACRFCNSLVDRIVPGKLPAADYMQMTEKLGYADDLMIMSEWYSLWAIESADPAVTRTLSFVACNPGVVITADIYKYRELKLRLLNGTHTFLCGFAWLAGFATVKEAMQHSSFKALAHSLMMEEIVPCLVGDKITAEEARTFAEQVLERFANPYIEHKWLSITLHYSTKMKARNLPLIKGYLQRHGAVPERMACCIAAYLLFNRCAKQPDGIYAGVTDSGVQYSITDDKAVFFAEAWQLHPANEVVDAVLQNEALWGENLATLPGFAHAVEQFLDILLTNGVAASLGQMDKMIASGE